MNVYPSDYALDASSDFMQMTFFRIPYASTYVHHAGGAGTYVMPEVGSWCWVCVPSDHNIPFVVGFTPINSANDEFKFNRLDLQPGDQATVSRDQNGVIVRRGGVTQIISTPLCQTTYSPVSNTLADTCENYSLAAGGGSLTWSVSKKNETEEQMSPTLLRLEAREFQQNDPTIIIQIGSVATPTTAASSGPSIPANKKIYLDLEIKDATNGAATYKYRVNLDGASFLLQNGKRSIHVKDNEVHFIDGDQELKISGNKTETIAGTLTRKAASEISTIRGESRENVGSKIIVARSIKLGSASGTQPAVKGDSLLRWLRTHVHGVPGTPPVVPPFRSAILSNKVFVG
jgi:hypothetical protein